VQLRGQRVCLPSANVARHVLVTGLTGAYKTTALTLPVLLDAARAGVSVVAFDLKYGERDSLASAAPEWWRCGRPVLAFAPLDGASLRWNPLASCRSFGDAHELATHLFPDDAIPAADATYWTGAERGVCASLIWAIVSDGTDPSLARLRTLAEAGPAAVAAYVRGHGRSAEVAAHLGAYSAMMPKDQAGILQGIASRLEALADDRVARAIGPAAGGEASWDEIVLERLRREPMLILVGVPQAALPRLKTLAQLLMRALAAQMLRPRAPGETVPVLYVLEELPAWGALPGLADHLATFRSRDVAIVATVQSEAQGQAVYGGAGWAAIAANFVTKIYFSSLADPDAERLSRALGVAAVEQVSRSRGWSTAGRHDGEQRRWVDVPLRRPQALQGGGTLDGEIILRCPALPPVRLWCPPFHERPEYAQRVPHVPPSTLEIAVRRMLTGERDLLERRPARRIAAEAVTPAFSRPVVPAHEDGRDGSALAAFVEAVLNRRGADRAGGGQTKDGADARVVCRGGRLAELRLDPIAAYRLLGGGDAAHALVRRWAARRWVKHLRPVFVLERCALQALDEDIQRRLLALASHGH
jgi:type IV secretory pathway TraG/TraD family ATPase VirD4